MNASECSWLREVIWDFENRQTPSKAVLVCLKEMISDGFIGIYRFEQPGADGLSQAEALRLVQTWEQLDTNEFGLFLTEEGLTLWQKDDFNMTRGEAHNLIFVNGNKVQRIPSQNNGSEIRMFFCTTILIVFFGAMFFLYS